MNLPRISRSRRREAASASNEQPLHAELFSVTQLISHAKTLAGWHKVLPPGSSSPDVLLQRLTDNEEALRDAHALVSEAVQSGTRITPAAEWFIDNYHLIEEQIRTARRHLPRTYNRELPRLARTLHAGVPRIYDLVLELVSHTHGRLDLESLRAFIAAYQSVPGQTLRLGELWAIPIMLRLALLENLRRVVDAVVAGRRDREAAGHWVERMIEVAAATPANTGGLKAAVQYAMAGMNAVMPVIKRASKKPYRWVVEPAPLAQVANHEKKMPKDFIREDGFGITAKCREYLEPLIRGESYPPYEKDGLPRYVTLRLKPVKKKLPEYRIADK